MERPKVCCLPQGVVSAIRETTKLITMETMVVRVRNRKTAQYIQRMKEQGDWGTIVVLRLHCDEGCPFIEQKNNYKCV